MSVSKNEGEEEVVGFGGVDCAGAGEAVAGEVVMDGDAAVEAIGGAAEGVGVEGAADTLTRAGSGDAIAFGTVEGDGVFSHLVLQRGM